MEETTDNASVASIIAQAREHGIEFGERYVDPHSGFEGVATSVYFFEHACVRVQLRGTNKSTGAPVECSFDAPELVRVKTEEKVPATRSGGPHDVTGRTVSAR